MSSETYSYKGISAGKYVEGTIDALSQEEASVSYTHLTLPTNDQV